LFGYEQEFGLEFREISLPLIDQREKLTRNSAEPKTPFTGLGLHCEQDTFNQAKFIG
jgi:hypothetical protein